MPKKIKKAVFPVAGLGTRFYPATKISAKEMMPIVNKPLIQYAVEEAVNAGIETLVFISGKNKRSIEDHFDRDSFLEKHLQDNKKTQALKKIKDIIPNSVKCVHIRQHSPLGLGNAVLQAESIIDEDEAFAVILADDLIDSPSGNSCTRQIIDAYQESEHENCCVCAIEKVSKKDVHKYGIVSPRPRGHAGSEVWPITDLVEKPDKEEAISTMAIIGRYILHAGIFDALRKIRESAGNEIQLTDALNDYAKSHKVLARRYYGKRYDCGNVPDYLLANIEYAYKDPDIRKELNKRFKGLKSGPRGG